MKDYYTDFIGKNSGNTPESAVSEVSKVPFVPFDTEQSAINPENSPFEDLLNNPVLKNQFEFEVQERIAILMYGSNLSETEAKQIARKNIEETWTALFLDDVLS